MKIEKILHILRNPYGNNHMEIRLAALAAADKIEKLQNANDILDKSIIVNPEEIITI